MLGDEKPAHRVTLSKGFWMGQTEVTVGAYKRFAVAGRHMPSAPPSFYSGWANDAMPIVGVSWDDSQAYCTWAGGRLPTEAEWEYAARAGSTGARYGPLDEIAWYADNSGRSRIDSARILNQGVSIYDFLLADNGNTMREVGQKRPNAFNLFDLLGNAWEWTSDWYGEKYYKGSPERDPPGADSGKSRVMRGGSWRDAKPRNVRVSFRRTYNPDYNIIDYWGVRCVGEVSP